MNAKHHSLGERMRCMECDAEVYPRQFHDYFECLREKVRRGTTLTWQQAGSLVDYGVAARTDLDRLARAVLRVYDGCENPIQLAEDDTADCAECAWCLAKLATGQQIERAAA